MDFQVTFTVNDKLFLRNPETSPLGKKIIKSGIDLIHEIGFEHFTFKKLAVVVQSTEASIYRYFENKQRLLLYILNWYWSYMEFLLKYKLQNISDPKLKLKIIINLLSNELNENTGTLDYNMTALNQIIISESSKAYLVKDVNDINQEHAFQPYKNLCSKIAEIICEYNPSYQFSRSLSSTLIETSHSQYFFAENLPKLTDIGDNIHKKTAEFIHSYLANFLFKILD
jgi:hypothetical protein